MTTEKTTRQVNRTVKNADVESSNISELNQNLKNDKGEFVGTELNEETLLKAEKERAKNTKLGKSVVVKTVSGGHMNYFDAKKTITGEPTVVPDSEWLRFQILHKRIEEVKE